MEFNEAHFRTVDKCPWCGSVNSKEIYQNTYGASIRKCECGLVYSAKILNEKGLDLYWKNYLSSVQNSREQLTQQRKKMYQIEYNFISNFLDVKSKFVLDVGCGNGGFLDIFKAHGAVCRGVEFGKEAAIVAGEKHQVFFGEFPRIVFEEKYDLVIFRGTLQYFINPKSYIEKAVQLLKEDGFLFITSSPNADSICFKLFKEKFVLPVGVTDYYAFHEELLTEYIEQLGGRLKGNYHFYRETPYANEYEDIKMVSRAIQLHEQGKEIDFKSPAFFDNMLSLVYQKGGFC